MVRRSLLSTAALAVTMMPAFAHPGDVSEAGALAAGFTHPFLGPDHMLAMVAVGLWAARLGGRAVWRVPAAFVACMVLGFALALAKMNLPAIEPGVAASVVVLGVLIAAAIRLPLALSAGLVGLFAIFHGHAHGADLTGAAPAFGLGLVVATVFLHAAGIGLGRLFAEGRRVVFARAAGAVMAGIGVVLLGGWS